MIEFNNVSKEYDNGTKALNGVNLHVDRGEFVFVVGASGAGKSTFLKMIMREEVPTGGSITVDGLNLNELRASKVPYYRRKLGIVFQDFRLIPTKTVYENVAFAMHVIGAKPKDISRRVAYALSLVGLTSKARSFPKQLSGGEQQRVALARALVNHADIIIADEPTGNVDPQMSKEIVDLLDQINRNDKTTIIMVTHAVDLIQHYNKRIVKISNGRVVSDTEHPEIAENVTEEETIPETKMSGYYQEPIPGSETEVFIHSYGKETATDELTVDEDADNQ